MGTVVVDSSIILALFDPNDTLNRSASDVVRQCRTAGDSIHVPTTVLAEVLVRAATVGDDAIRVAERFVDEIVEDVWPVDRAMARAAATLRASHPAVRLPDAIVIAAAQTHAADAVYTGDKRWRAVDPRVRVVGVG